MFEHDNDKKTKHPTLYDQNNKIYYDVIMVQHSNTIFKTPL